MPGSSRRRFLGQLLGGTAAAVAFPARLTADDGRSRWTTLQREIRTLGSDEVADEAFWRLVKDQFPLRRGLILMNAANLCPSPYPVQEAVFRFTRDVDAPGVEALTGDTGFTEADPAWSPGGEAILFARSEGTDSNLWVVPNVGTNPVQVTFGAGVVGDGGPAWSPDGAKVAFHSDRDGNLDIWVME